jgi:TPR repeat protein
LGSVKDWIILKNHADAGNMLAAAMVAACYSMNVICIVPTNRCTARSYANQALAVVTREAEQHHCKYAEYLMGRFYDDGLSVKKNPTKAIEWYLKSARQEYAYAQQVLGYCYRVGIGEENVREAVIWSSRAAAQHDPAGQCSLGVCYAEGKGVERDPEEAHRLFTLAALQNYPVAQCNVADNFRLAIGTNVNLTEAIRYYRLAAKQHYAQAQFKLGCVYENGEGGVVQDINQARYWFLLAADQGNKAAKEKMKMIK